MCVRARARVFFIYFSRTVCSWVLLSKGPVRRASWAGPGVSTAACRVQARDDVYQVEVLSKKKKKKTG